MSHLAAVKVFFTRYEAEQAKGLLDEQGIPSFIQADDCGGFYANLTLVTGNVKLIVNDRDLARAGEILKVMEE